MGNKLWSYFNQSENKYIAYAGVFAVVYFFWLLPILRTQFQSSSVYLQFFIFNIGILTVITIYLKGKALNTSFHFTKALEYMCVVLALNTWTPDYHIDMVKGTLIEGGEFGKSTIDYIAGFFAINSLHLSGILVAIFTYLVVPISLLYIAKTISKSNFVKVI